MADLVVEATGAPEGFRLARTAVRPAGTIVLKSTYAGSLDLNLSSIVVDEITLLGSRCGPFGPALRLMERQQVDPQVLIDARYPLAQVEACVRARRAAGRIEGPAKPLICGIIHPIRPRSAMDRAPDFESVGSEFESRRGRQMCRSMRPASPYMGERQRIMNF